MTRISRIEMFYDDDGDLEDVTFYFCGDETPYCISEFKEDSETYKKLRIVLDSLQS